MLGIEPERVGSGIRLIRYGRNSRSVCRQRSFARRRISAAMKARWAARKKDSQATRPSKGKAKKTAGGPQMSLAARKKLLALMKARWAARKQPTGVKQKSGPGAGVRFLNANCGSAGIPAPEASWCSPDLTQGAHAHLVESVDAMK